MCAHLIKYIELCTIIAHDFTVTRHSPKLKIFKIRLTEYVQIIRLSDYQISIIIFYLFFF